MNVGLFGGTFDPPHIGHLVIADQALTELGLDEIWFAPVGQPTHKTGRSTSAAAHRAAMTRLAIATHPRFRLCEEDINRDGPHYSLTLVQRLIDTHPQVSWFFIIGEDSLVDLPKWHRPEALFALVQPVVAHRPGVMPGATTTAAVDTVVPGLSARIRWIGAPLLDLSSTDLRARLRQGRSVRYLLPRAVADYARDNQLYSGAVLDESAR